MITYVNKENANSYNVLFSKATQALIQSAIDANDQELMSIVCAKDEQGRPITVKGPEGYPAGDPITTIEKYFYYLPKLVQLDGATANDEYTKLHSAGRRYTMLPLSEPAIKINANTRVIDVASSDFSKNGIAVQGDELAEIIYFEVDRFFDAMDLDTASIYIQWTTPNKETGVSMPWVVDIESIPNKIIFGWAVTSAMTEVAGDLSFAVRFYQWDNKALGTLKYSWSTQTAKLPIKAALDFKLGKDGYLEDLKRDVDIFGRILDSETHLTHNEVAQAPIFMFNIEDNANVSAVSEAQEGVTTYKVVYADLEGTVGADGKQHRVLKVQAKSPDSGIISYDWKFIDADGAAHAEVVGSADDPSHSSVRVDYLVTDDLEANSEKVYYAEVDGVYAPFDPAGLPSTETPHSYPLYEKFAFCDVSCVGTFYSVAMNTKVGTNKKSLESTRCIVPVPMIPVIDEPIAANKNDEAYGTEGDRYGLVIKAGERATGVTLSVTVDHTETNGSANGTLTYQWYMRNDLTDKDGNAIERVALAGKTGETLLLNFEEGQQPKDLEGFYSVKVTNTKNGVSKSDFSEEIRVSYDAAAPEIAFPKTSEDTKVDFNSTGKKLEVKLDEEWLSQWNISDRLEYQWYYTTDETIGNDNDTPVIINNAGEFSTVEDGGFLAKEATLVPPSTGKYFCIVTNHKNHSEASAISEIFFVA